MKTEKLKIPNLEPDSQTDLPADKASNCPEPEKKARVPKMSKAKKIEMNEQNKREGIKCSILTSLKYENIHNQNDLDLVEENQLKWLNLSSKTRLQVTYIFYSSLYTVKFFNGPNLYL